MRLAPCTHAPRPLPLLLRCAESGWLRPQAEEALRKAARDGDLATLKRLVEMGVSVNAEDEVCAAPAAAPTLSAPRPPASPPAAPVLPRPHRCR